MRIHQAGSDPIFKIDNKSSIEEHEVAGGIYERRFNPYIMNEGTVAAVAGKDFCVVAGDTRVSMGYFILSRDCSKVTKLTEKCVIASAGMRADAIALHKVLKTKIKMYHHQFNKEPSITAIAQMLSNTLYGRRFFPYYAFNILCGVDETGAGAMFGYDAIGSYDRINSGAEGSGS